MKFKLKRSAIFFLFLTSIVVISYAGMNPFVPVVSNPDINYKVVSTKYLNVVYEPSSEWAVYRFLKDCDKLYDEITSFYNTQPFSRLTVVFENDTNIVNSLADPVDNVIYIFLNSSQRGFFSLDFNSWVDFVFSHELTHILLTQTGGSSQIRVYGNPLSTVYNSAFIPAYLQEGLAQYSETHFNANVGRLNDPLFEMYLKGLVLDKKLNGFGGAATYNSNGWYPIGAPYVVGGSFIRYISTTYGETVLKKALDVLWTHHALGVSYAFEKATKIPFEKLVKNWLSDTKKEVESQISKIGTRIEGIQLTHDGRWTAFSDTSSDKTIFYYSENPNDVPRIKKYELSNSSIQDVYSLGGFLYQGGYVTSMSISDDGEKLAFVRFVSQDGGFVNQSVCFILNLKNGTLLKLPIKNPLDVSWLSEDEIVYSQEDGGLYSIKKYNLKNGTFETLMHSSPMVITSLTTRKNDVYFCASIKGDEDVYKLSDGKVIRLISGDYLKVDPFITKDGRYILFSAAKPERDSVFNIYAFDTLEKRFYQVTNVELGAFSPHLVGDKLFYTGYTKNGYNLFVLDRWMSTSKEINGFKWENTPYQSDLNLTEIYLNVEKKSKPYSPSIQTIASGIIPTAYFSSSSSTLNATYTIFGFDVLRSKLGWNNFYSFASVSTDRELDSLTFGMNNYGKYNLSADVFLNLKIQMLHMSLSYPVTSLIGGRDFLFYPSFEYTLKHKLKGLEDEFDFYGTMIYNPSFVPNNVLNVNSLRSDWKVNFSPLKPATPVYNVSLDTAFPLFYGVEKIGTIFSNSSINFFQNFAFPNLNVNWYDLSGAFGLKTIDFMLFSNYEIRSQDFNIGIQSNFNFDSFFYSEFKLSIKIAYDRLKNGLEYDFGLNF